VCHSVHLVCRDKRIATAAVREVPGLRVPRENTYQKERGEGFYPEEIKGFAAGMRFAGNLRKTTERIGGKGVRFFRIETELDEVVEYVYGEAQDEDGPIVQERFSCPMPIHRGEPCYWNVRIYMTPDGRNRVV